MGAFWVVEVNKRAGGLEPQLTTLALWHGLHVLVKHMQVTQQNFAHRALVGQPFLGVAGGEAQAFGGAVVLVNDGAPPVDHLLLHGHGAGCGGVDGDGQGRQVVAHAHVGWQLEHAAEHGGHKLRVGDAMALHQLQVVLGVEVLHDDHGAAVANGQRRVGLWRRVVQRRGRQIQHAVNTLPKFVQEVKQRQGLRRWVFRQGPQDALGATRGAG